MRIFSYCLLGLVLIACSPSKEENEASELTGVATFFPDFPKKQYKSLVLGDSIQKIEVLLAESGYEEQKNNQRHWKNESWQTEVILPESDIMYEFKVFIYDEKLIGQGEEFKSFFEQRSSQASSGREFSVFYFTSSKASFNVTLFEQPKFIRLQYELKSSH